MLESRLGYFGTFMTSVGSENTDTSVDREPGLSSVLTNDVSIKRSVECRFDARLCTRLTWLPLSGLLKCIWMSLLLPSDLTFPPEGCRLTIEEDLCPKAGAA